MGDTPSPPEFSATSPHPEPVAAPPSCAADPERRFGGIKRLYGAGAAGFAQAHVVVVGVGGVGSWAAEALARSGVGRITLLDADHVAESNINRQVHALDDTLGMAKIAAMQARIRAINPACEVRMVDDFLSPDNLDLWLGTPFDHLIDAIDQVRTKAALVAWCRASERRLVVCGAAGGKQDASRIRLGDLAHTEHDPLLAKVRQRLRQQHGFPRPMGQPFQVPCVYSDEAAHERLPGNAGPVDGAAGLACAGYGSAMHITATVGLLASSVVLNDLARHALRGR